MIIGKIDSGKTTLAKYFTNHGYTEYTFADPIKQFAVSIGFEQHEVFGTQEEKLMVNKTYNISGREFLQKFGTDVCREKLTQSIPNMNLNGLGLWARVMEAKLQKNTKIVISDGRFEDEAELVKKYNGVIIRIHRECDSDYGGHSAQIEKHVSEVAMDNITADIIINNSGTLDDLRIIVNNIMKELS